MKSNMHPEYKRSRRLFCACGSAIETRSTRGDFHVEICASCHPFFTGKSKLIDTVGRVDRFRKKYAAQAAAVAAAATAKK